jgi:hypothetical protein
MKKYIFTESQIKSLIDNQLNEQMMGSVTTTGNLANMIYDNVKPELVDLIKKSGKFTVVDFENTGRGIFLSGNNGSKPVAKGQIITPQTNITIPMSSYLYVSGMGLRKAVITMANDNKLSFSGYVA